MRWRELTKHTFEFFIEAVLYLLFIIGWNMHILRNTVKFHILCPVACVTVFGQVQFTVIHFVSDYFLLAELFLISLFVIFTATVLF
jgi:hypothetical protein